MEKKQSKRRILWFLVFLLLAILTLRAVTRGSESFTPKRFQELLHGASPVWLAAAVLCMFGFVLFEALSLRYLEGFFGHRRPIRRNVVYAAADIYFSAITPSATGGQPASAVFMVRDGIPAAVTAMCLLLNVMLYTVSVLILGILCFCFCPGAFFSFSPLSRALILLGFLIQSLFVVGLLLLVLKEQIILRLAGWGLRLLHKLHLVRDIESKQQSLHRMAQEYRECIGVFRRRAGVVVGALLLNLLQRFCNIGVTLFIFFAVGGPPEKAVEILVTQGFVVLGSNAVPIPGAVGVSDYLFLDGFHRLIPDTACVELLCRGLSFYVCLLLCGLTVLFATLGSALRKRHGAPRT